MVAMALVPRVRQIESKVRSCILTLDVYFEAMRVGEFECCFGTGVRVSTALLKGKRLLHEEGECYLSCALIRSYSLPMHGPFLSYSFIRTTIYSHQAGMQSIMLPMKMTTETSRRGLCALNGSRGSYRIRPSTVVAPPWIVRSDRSPSMIAKIFRWQCLSWAPPASRLAH